MSTPGLIISVDSASLVSAELKNAFAILSNLPSLDEFNNVKKVLNLAVPNELGFTTLSTFLRFCVASGLDLSNEGVRLFKANNPPLDPDKPILGNTAMVYYKALFDKDLDSGCPWMEFAKAELAASVREFSGSADNPRIVEYHRATTLAVSDSTNDETPWCSSFLNWCMMKAEIKRTKSALARSWLTWGDKLNTPKYGCVVVLWRDSPTSGSGHVGFFVKSQGDNIILLGGNQGDAVTQAPFPRSRLLSYRWPEVGDRLT